MNVWVRTTVFAASAAIVVAATSAPPKAESRLAGIKLYDSGVDVVRKMGSPTDIFAITWQGTGGGGGGAGGGGGGFAGPSPAGGGGKGGATPGGIDFVIPPMSVVPPAGFNQAMPAGKGGGGGGGGGGQTPDFGGSGGGASGVTDTQYVRWVYRRNAASSLNVVLNKFNKVVQIEAIGVSNKNVRTSRGITLGSTLAEVIKRYQNPDAYEVGGDYFMVRFLRSAKVAFRFTRENATTPYRVTGIVVSAGKT